jgi:hypothetical protein
VPYRADTHGLLRLITGQSKLPLNGPVPPSSCSSQALDAGSILVTHSRLLHPFIYSMLRKFYSRRVMASSRFIGSCHPDPDGRDIGCGSAINTLDSAHSINQLLEHRFRSALRILRARRLLLRFAHV